MKPLPYQPSTHEQQIAMAILAHATRHDNDALAMSLNLLAESPDELHPLCVMAALVSAFQRGLDADNSDVVAQRFSDTALSLAATDAAD